MVSSTPTEGRGCVRFLELVAESSKIVDPDELGSGRLGPGKYYRVSDYLNQYRKWLKLVAIWAITDELKKFADIISVRHDIHGTNVERRVPYID